MAAPKNVIKKISIKLNDVVAIANEDANKNLNIAIPITAINAEKPFMNI